MILHIVKPILEIVIMLVKNFPTLCKKSIVYIACIVISVIISLSITKYHFIHTIDEVNNADKVAFCRRWLERVVNRIKDEQKTNRIYARSLKYHANKNSGAWCMGQQNMRLDLEYLDRPKIYLEPECKKFLESVAVNEKIITKQYFSHHCYHLAKDCVFSDPTYPNLDRAFIKCKYSISIPLGILCVFIVYDTSLEEQMLIKELKDFQLDKNLDPFGD